MIKTCIICATISLISFLIYLACNNYIKEIIKIKQIKNKNELYNLYNSIDVEKYDRIINAKIENIFKKWILINISVNDIVYIKSEDIEECIRYTVKTFIMELSDTYLFYIKCLTIINNDDDMVNFVRERTKLQVLAFVTEFNKGIEE